MYVHKILESRAKISNAMAAILLGPLNGSIHVFELRWKTGATWIQCNTELLFNMYTEV